MNSKLDPETLGAATGISGALLLAMNNSATGKIGWLCFLASNFFWLIFALRGNFRKLFWQQIAFACTSLIGIWNSFPISSSLREFVSSVFT